MRRWLKILLAVGLLGGAGLVSLFAFVLVNGPRMKVQPNVRTFQRVAPLPPSGTVPSIPSPFTPAAVSAASPLPAATSENLARGKAYYELYCLFCHGEKGHGDGPVGNSYHPVPADLTSASVRAKSASELHVAMLTGTGHSPVLEKVVPAGHRSFVLLYFLTLR